MTRIATSLPRLGRAWTNLLLTAVAVGASIAAGGQTVQAAPRVVVLVLPASGSNVSEVFPGHARNLLLQILGQARGVKVVDLNRPPTNQPPSPAAAAGLARAFNASMALVLDLTHQGEQTTMTLACVDAVQAQVTCSFVETTPATPQVIPHLTQRLANRLIASLNGASSVPTAGLIEAPPRSTRRWSLMGQATVLLPVASPRATSQALAGWDLTLALDEGDLRVDLSGEYTGDSTQRVQGVGLGLFRPMRADQLTLYVGGRAFWINQRLGGRGASGAQLRPTVGLRWGRPATIALHLEAGYFVSLFQEREADRLFVGSDKGHVAHGVLLSLGVSL